MFTAGEVVDGRYEVLGPLGVGGMAHVFKARDLHLERVVALKVLRPHLTETDSERFRREIRALAQLNHPGIVSIYDLGSGDKVYFAMELIEGGPITDLGPVDGDLGPLARLLEASAVVAEALAYVHRLGMVHRDLTPRNILLTQQGMPKVMDFGLVQLTETSKQLTRTGLTLGTPQYMAPEQATGEATGAATDLYAFGAVLYRTLTGLSAFEGENDQAVLYQHVYGKVTPPSELNPQVPEALSRLVMSLLEKEPARRPASGTTVAETLRAVLASVRRAAVGLPGAGPGRHHAYPSGPPLPQSLNERWRVNLAEGPQFPSGLTAAGGFLLVGQRSDALAVLRPADGAQHAVFELDDEASQPPLVLQGRVYVTSRSGSMLALSWPGGEVLWRRDGEDVVGGAPLGRDVVVAAGDRVELWTAEGDATWRVKLGGGAVAAPTLHRDLALVPADDGWLHAVRLSTGKHAFKVQVGPMASPPAATGGVALVPVRTGELHAFDLEKRDVVWTYDLEGEQWSTPVVWQQYVYATSWGQRIHALALASGDDMWTRPLPAAVTATPAMAAGALYIGTETGDVVALDGRTGRVLHSRRVATGSIQASPLPLGDAVFVAALDGTVVALS